MRFCHPARGTACVLLLSSLVSGLGAVVFEEDFDKYPPAEQLAGCGGWELMQQASGGISSAQIGTGVKGLAAVSSGSEKVEINTHALSEGPGNKYVLEASVKIDDLDTVAGEQMAAVGLGNDGTMAAHFGILPAGVFGVRSENFGETFIVRDSSGQSVKAKPGHWYKIKSEWLLDDAPSATFYLQDLTEGETEYQQVFFDNGQMKESVSLTQAPPLKEPTHCWLRLGSKGGAIDDIKIARLP